MTEMSNVNDTNINNEIWKPVKGWEGLYEVSNYGRLKRLEKTIYQGNRHKTLSKYILREQIIKPSTRGRNSPYLNFTLRDGKKRVEYFSVHRLVAMHFLDKPEGKDYINHLDSNPHNNFAGNLEWCTQSENIQYAYDNGTKIPPHQKQVGQYDMDGNLIAVWVSKTAAGRALGIPQTNINKVCLGLRNHAGGFKWAHIQ